MSDEPGSAGAPPEDWRPLADRIAKSARDFLDGLTAVARGESGDDTVPLLLLEVAQVMLAGAQLGASKDIILPNNWEPDVGADPDLEQLYGECVSEAMCVSTRNVCQLKKLPQSRLPTPNRTV